MPATAADPISTNFLRVRCDISRPLNAAHCERVNVTERARNLRHVEVVRTNPTNGGKWLLPSVVEDIPVELRRLVTYSRSEIKSRADKNIPRRIGAARLTERRVLQLRIDGRQVYPVEEIEGIEA